MVWTARNSPPAVLATILLASGCFAKVDEDAGSGGSGDTEDTGNTGDTGDTGDGTSGTENTGSDDNGSGGGDTGTGDTGTSDTGSDGGGTGTDTGTTQPPPLECVDERLDPATGTPVVQSTNDAAGDDFLGSCGGDGSPDVAYEWFAPASDYFRFDTLNSTFDTVLYLFDDTCDGTELACNDNDGMVPTSRVVEQFERGDRAVVVVDGNAGATGDVALNIERVTCPGTDLTGQTFPVSLTTVGGTSNHGGACGGDDQLEKAYRYTPPSDGIYVISASSTAFEPAVYLEAGPICGGPQLACNSTGGQVSRHILGGKPVTIFVDSVSGSGAFDLDIQPIDSTCPNDDSSNGPFTDSFDNHDRTLSTSCGDTIEGGTSGELNVDAIYSWSFTHSPGVGCSCQATVNSGFPVALALLGGGCGGPELSCTTNGTWSDSTSTYETVLDLPTDRSGDYVIVVQQQYSPLVAGSGPEFDFEVGCGCVA